MKALAEERGSAKVTRHVLGQRLDLHRSKISKQLSGEESLTLRSVAELSWALDREISFHLSRPAVEDRQNVNAETSTIGWKQPTIVNMPAANHSDRGFFSRDAGERNKDRDAAI
ncbi:hypothetical protein [Beijerinckia sp. L45]|uniref:hypothetical protein n=1 Tax=Beijerinckia sp. L45 TaxID=1641855 RepID=UPI00131B6A38|nr:hypothetical protein [Beijerinckia sp. L45]